MTLIKAELASCRLVGLLHALSILVDHDSHSGPFGEGIKALTDQALEASQELNTAIVERPARQA